MSAREWGVRGPSGRVWRPEHLDSAGNPVAAEDTMREFAAGTGMPLVSREPGGEWVDAGLPTFEEMRRNAFRLLGDAADELRSDWRTGTGPSAGAGRARIEALEHIAKAKAALDRAAR